jgi:hypothetical protein
MDLKNFENDIFWQNFNTNLNKIVQRKILKILKSFLKSFFENILRIFSKKWVVVVSI